MAFVKRTGVRFYRTRKYAHHSLLPILFTEKEFMYDMVVRDSTSGEDGAELLNKSSFSLYDNDAWLHRSYSQSSERATTANVTAILLTGEAAFDTYSYSYGHSSQR